MFRDPSEGLPNRVPWEKGEKIPLESGKCCDICLQCPDGYEKHQFCHNKDCPCHKPEPQSESWEDSILASVRMLRAFSFHKDMAQTAQRAKDQQGLFEDEYKRLIYKISTLLSSAVEKERKRVVGLAKGMKKEHYLCGEDPMAEEMKVMTPDNESLWGSDMSFAYNKALQDVIKAVTTK